jgi:hypothetical protein
MLFHWVRGIDAQSLLAEGVLSASDANRLVSHVYSEMIAKGFRALDTKPSHIILRHREATGLVQRNSKIVYAMVDFELLQRTKEYEQWREMRG